MKEDAWMSQARDTQTRDANSARARMASSRPATRGDTTQFTNQYNAGLRMYPEDLMDPTHKYGGNYVVFYINVHEDSTLFRNNQVSVVEGNIPTRQKGFLSGQRIDDDTAKKSSIMINTLGGGAAGAITNAIGISSGGPLVGAAIGGLATAAAVTEVGKIKAEYKRINQAIALYMPIDLNISYGVNWFDEDMAGAGAMLGLGENALNALDNAGKNIMNGNTENIKSELGAGLGTISSFTAGAVLNATHMGQAISKMSGVAQNPKKEQMFKSVDHRTFSFSYQFFSRSPEEAQQVRDIIKLFKMHMHPEYKQNTGNFLYLYPSEFDIMYYNNGVENMNLHRHTSCVLTNVNIQYTPLGQYISFADGMPTQINVVLTFKELALLDKDLIADGF